MRTDKFIFIILVRVKGTANPAQPETEEQVEAAIEAEHPFLEGFGLTPEVPMRQTCNCGGPDV
jgi:hypothetical protein